MFLLVDISFIIMVYLYYIYTIWLFNIANWEITIFKFGKPSISMGHGFHGELLVITRGYIILIEFAGIYEPTSMTGRHRDAGDTIL